MKRVIWALLGLACCAAQGTPKLTGTFTNMRFGTQDVSGAEITVVFTNKGYYVIAQCAEGMPGVPEAAAATIEGTRLTFTLEEDSKSGCGSGTYKGTISAEGLKSKFLDLPTDWPGFLKRGKSYWQ